MWLGLNLFSVGGPQFVLCSRRLCFRRLCSWRLCLESMSWVSVLCQCLGSVCWVGVLGQCCGWVSWVSVLIQCLDSVSWVNVLGQCLGFCVVLAVSSVCALGLQISPRAVIMLCWQFFDFWVCKCLYWSHLQRRSSSSLYQLVKTSRSSHADFCSSLKSSIADISGRGMHCTLKIVTP